MDVCIVYVLKNLLGQTAIPHSSPINKNVFRFCFKHCGISNLFYEPKLLEFRGEALYIVCIKYNAQLGTLSLASLVENSPPPLHLILIFLN